MFTQRPHLAAAVTAPILFALTLSVGLQATPAVAQDRSDASGILTTRSAYSVAETAQRIRAFVEAEGILYFTTIDQQALAADAGIALRPARLVMFGNPPLGALFLESNPMAGLDWPVRVQVFEDADGQVFAAYQDWDFVADRYAIADRQMEFDTATEVVAAIMASIADCDVVADCTE